MKKRKRLRLKDIQIVDIENFIKEALKKIEKINYPKKGRPKTYSDAFIITIFFIKTINNLSFREVVYWFKQLKGKTPSISTLHYRFSKISLNVLKKLFRILKKKLSNKVKEKKLMIVDGTGFGFDKTFLLKWLRGAELRKVRSHVKVVLIVIRTYEGQDIIYNLETAPAYSDERKLAIKMMKKIRKKVFIILADSLYGMSIKFIKESLKLSDKVLIPIKDGIHNKVRNKIRKQVKEEFKKNKDIYKKRYIIEQVIGKIKNSYGDREMTKSYELSEKYVWIKFIAYNLAVSLSMGLIRSKVTNLFLIIFLSMTKK